MKNKKIGLNDAYSLKTPKDSIKLYKNWATTYDKEFATKSKYNSPLKIVNYFNKYSNINDTPILDVGAGTGLIGKYLNKKKDKDIIGIDISSEMLKEANLKKSYSSLLEVDITKKIPFESNLFGSVISSGTFTLGHVGPEALDELLRVIKPGGIFVISIHTEVFLKEGFKEKFLEIKNKITKPIFHSFKIFGKNSDKLHGNVKSLAAIFRKNNEFTKI
tara:strand:- start:1324 stop:1977 length:654 start_codon:yes stop_codon:yes gene_type:complete